MATRYEVQIENGDTFFFHLRSGDGRVILRSLGSPSKIMTQNEILHLRDAVRDPARLVSHDDHGRYFLVVKDRDGSVLAKSPRVDSGDELQVLTKEVIAAAAAPIVDLCKRAVAQKSVAEK